MQSEKISYARIIGAFFTVGSLLGALAGIIEWSFRVHLTRFPLFSESLDVIAKPLMFSGFYACLYGAIALLSAAVLGKIPVLFKDRCPSILAFWITAFSVAVMYLSVPINKMIPPIFHMTSILVNLGLLSGGLALALILFFITGRAITKIFPKYNPTRSGVLLFVAVTISVCGILVCRYGAFHTPSNSPLSHSISTGPNVLLISVDTLRADHLPEYGYPEISTPTITNLAVKGILFEDAYSTTSWTLPACGSLMTGLSPRAMNLQESSDTLPSKAATIARVMQKSGRTTLAVSSNPFITRAYGFDRGFDRFINVYDKGLRPALSGIFIFDHIFRLRYSLDDASNVNKLALNSLKELKDKSWFFWVHYMDPHKPYGGPWPLDLPSYDKGYDGSITFIYGWAKPINELKEPLSEADMRHVKALYDADILRFDKYLGRLLRKMKGMGLMNNTYVLLVADHGEEFLEHGDFEHGKNLHKEQTHVPLIIVGPGIPEGFRHKGLVSIKDIPKTICSLTGVEPAKTFTGDSLYPFPGDILDKPLFGETHSKGRDMLSVRFRNPGSDRMLFLYNPKTGTRQLFDLGKDPGEYENLAEHHPEKAEDAFLLMNGIIKEENVLGLEFGTGEKVKLDANDLDALKGLGYLVE